MSDPRATAAEQPSPEELRAYFEQLRAADAAGLLAEAYNMLAAGAQVKLGRPDARTLIDAMGAMVEAVATSLPAELGEQMRQGVAQLQLAQVEAEREVAAQGAGAAAETGEAGESASTPPPQPSAPPTGQRLTDRLWVPGRDSGPGPT